LTFEETEYGKKSEPHFNVLTVSELPGPVDLEANEDEPEFLLSENQSRW
tara:strand:- start:283 stop:429 length:147 start_codon:yes stop_codon:yes gene_type:complete